MNGQRREDRGASSVEYGLIVFAIAGLIAVIVFALGQVNSGSLVHSCDTIETKVRNGATANCP